MSKVFLGVGHGGVDSGAVGNGLKEKDLNLQIALACRDELERHGVIVGMSRTKDENDPLNDEVKECNAFNPDLAIDIHNNAGGGDGVEAYYSLSGGVSKTLALNVLKEIYDLGQNVHSTKPKDYTTGAKTRRGSNGDYYGFIRLTKAPAILLECAFIDTAKDIAIIDTKAEQQKMGIAIAKGILKTLGVTYTEPQKSESGKLYRVQVGAYSVRGNAEAMKAGLEKLGFDAIIVEVQK